MESLDDYIKRLYMGYRVQFQKAEGIKNRQQVNEWLSKKWVVIGDNLCSPKGAIKTPLKPNYIAIDGQQYAIKRKLSQ